MRGLIHLLDTLPVAQCLEIFSVWLRRRGRTLYCGTLIHRACNLNCTPMGDQDSFYWSAYCLRTKLSIVQG